MKKEKKILRVLEDWGKLLTGSVMVSVGVHFFKAPNGFSTGGVSGISIITAELLPGLSTGLMFTIINFAILLAGFMFLGREVGIRTTVCSFLVSGCTWLFEIIFPVSEPLTDQPFLELVYAILLTGIGAAVLFNADASSGGTDIVALILKQYTSLNVGKALLCTDFIITVAAFPVFGLKAGLFSLLGLFTKAFLVDGIIENMNVCKSFMIVTTDPEPIVDYIINEMGHSATTTEGYGEYTHTKRKIIYTLCKRIEAARLKKKIRELDPGAFVIVESTSEIIGRGFRSV